MYFHIYFNNNKEEIKRNYLEENEQINSIKIIIDYPIKSFKYLFQECDCIESINFKKFYRKNIENLYCMFYNCSSLKELNLSNFHTDSVTNMSFMFYRCFSLKEINLSNFNTNNVTSMNRMFGKCSKELKKKIRAKYNNIKEEAYGDLFEY